MRRVVGLLAVLALVVVAPGAASAAGWSKVAAPKDSGLQAVSCVSHRSCEAVGSWRNGALAEHWNGSRWSMQAVGGVAGALNGVTCTSGRSCLAVGLTFNAQPLIGHFDGRRWSDTTAPGRRFAGGRFGTSNVLSAVACPAANLCFAVGNTAPRGHGRVAGKPLIERWDGRRWRLVATPRAAGPLTSISCTSPRACTAVGGVELAQGQDSDLQISDVSLAMGWDGTSWSIESFPRPTGAVGARPLGISCVGSRDCLAVGSSLNDDMSGGGTVDGLGAMTGAWDGSAWSSETLPAAPGSGQPDVPADDPEDELFGISCASTSSCAAVGLARDTTGRLGPLAAHWDGTEWTQTLLRVGAPVSLDSVSCPSAHWCMAVGPTRAERFSG
jgi:hypothetical protein